MEILRSALGEISILAVLEKSSGENLISTTFSILKPEQKTLKSLFNMRASPHHKKVFNLERNAGNKIGLFILVSDEKGIFYRGDPDFDFSGPNPGYELIELPGMDRFRLIEGRFLEEGELGGTIILLLWEALEEKGQYYLTAYRKIRGGTDGKGWVQTCKQRVEGEKGMVYDWSSFVYEAAKGHLLLHGYGSKPDQGADIIPLIIQLDISIELRIEEGQSTLKRSEQQDQLSKPVLLRSLPVGPAMSIQSTPQTNYPIQLVRGKGFYSLVGRTVAPIGYYQDADSGAWLIDLVKNREILEEDTHQDIIGVGTLEDKNLESYYETNEPLPCFFLSKRFEVLLEQS